MERNILRGILAGGLATLVLSAMMLTQGTVPQLPTITLLQHVSGGLAEVGAFPRFPYAGWVLHFFIGTVWWGALFGLMAPILPGKRCWAKGVGFGLGAGFFVLLMVMPLAGAGYFGMAWSPIQVIDTLLLHLVYGAVLGAAYGHVASGCYVVPPGRVA
jgi:hypothetical protein